MVFEHIEKLKQEYTDKYVVVDGSRPELRRFNDMTGVIKTVNMNGRALVEFDGHLNIGWYDIELDFLKVVDKPIEKPAEKAAPKKAPAKKAAEKPAAKAKPAGMSPADILAAARGGSAPEKKPATKPAMSAADILAAARGGGAPAAEKPKAEKPKVDAASMSAADILAAARGGSAPAAREEVKEEPAAEPAPEPTPEPTETAVSEEPTVELKKSVAELPTKVADILAFCRDADS